MPRGKRGGRARGRASAAGKARGACLERGRREVEGGADIWAPAGSEREEEGWRVGLGWCWLFGPREKKERGELGWAGEGGGERKSFVFFQI